MKQPKLKNCAMRKKIVPQEKNCATKKKKMCHKERKKCAAKKEKTVAQRKRIPPHLRVVWFCKIHTADKTENKHDHHKGTIFSQT